MSTKYVKIPASVAKTVGIKAEDDIPKVLYYVDNTIDLKYMAFNYTKNLRNFLEVLKFSKVTSKGYVYMDEDNQPFNVAKSHIDRVGKKYSYFLLTDKAKAVKLATENLQKLEDEVNGLNDVIKRERKKISKV